MNEEKPSGDEKAGETGEQLHWIETYFILFPHDRRPALKQVEAALARTNQRLRLGNLAADDQGRFESLLVESEEDHAAVEVSYEVGESVIEQTLGWAKQLKEELPAEQLQAMMLADARLDVAHFERLNSEASPTKLTGGYLDEDLSEEESLEMFDPTCLLTVVDALASLTGGLTFDPASGEILP